jgi:Domain of unknown function (DUF4167)
MRPGQNNKRMRGRNSNRKGPNPLTRAYESNGPDVKIRGTAHHIAEKYLQLARDAQSSGDTVAAESYLQHAEHYFRLIAAAQQAQQQAQFGFQRPPGEAAETEEAEDEEDFAGLPDRFASPLDRSQQPTPQPPQNYAGGPQPYQDRGPYNGERQPGGQHSGSGQHGGGDRPERVERGPRPERPYNDRNYQDRSGQPGRNRDGRRDRPQYRDDYRGERTEGAEPRPVREMPPRDNPADVEQPVNGLPAFITAPVRIPAAEPEIIETTPDVRATEPPASDGPEETGRFPLRSRRRRRGRPEGEGNDSGISETPSDSDEVPASK